MLDTKMYRIGILNFQEEVNIHTYVYYNRINNPIFKKIVYNWYTICYNLRSKLFKSERREEYYFLKNLNVYIGTHHLAPTHFAFVKLEFPSLWLIVK